MSMKVMKISYKKFFSLFANAKGTGIFTSRNWKKYCQLCVDMNGKSV